MTSGGPTSSDDGPRIEGLESLELIGWGGFGAVYRAYQPALNRHVAAKVLAAARFDDRIRRRFEREQRAMGALSSHPGIVTLHHAGFTAGGSPFLVMELMEGGSLGDRVAASGPLGWREAAQIIERVAGAVQAAHEAGVLHRDIKPDNVLVSRYGEAKLADFGIAALMEGTATATTSVTATVEHAAPEVLGGGQPTEAADVYSLGSTFFTLLAGHSPFRVSEDESVISIIGRVATQPIPDLRERGVPDAICEVIEAALAKDPGDRIPSMAEFSRQLRDAVAIASEARAPGEQPQETGQLEETERDEDPEHVPVESEAIVAIAPPGQPGGSTRVILKASEPGPESTESDPRVRELADRFEARQATRKRLAIAIPAAALAIIVPTAIALTGGEEPAPTTVATVAATQAATTTTEAITTTRPTATTATTAPGTTTSAPPTTTTTVPGVPDHATREYLEGIATGDPEMATATGLASSYARLMIATDSWTLSDGPMIGPGEVRDGQESLTLCWPTALGEACHDYDSFEGIGRPSQFSVDGRPLEGSLWYASRGHFGGWCWQFSESSEDCVFDYTRSDSSGNLYIDSQAVFLSGDGATYVVWSVLPGMRWTTFQRPTMWTSESASTQASGCYSPDGNDYASGVRITDADATYLVCAFEEHAVAGSLVVVPVTWGSFRNEFEWTIGSDLTLYSCDPAVGACPYL